MQKECLSQNIKSKEKHYQKTLAALNTRPCYIICILLLLRAFSSSGQTISGVVIDKETLLPLPYASIGIKNRNIGAIADRTGQFSINISQAGNSDLVIISSIGYESINMSIKDFNLNGTNRIIVQPKIRELEEVVVVARPEPVVLGNSDYNSDFTGWGDFTSSRGRCRGLKIESKEFSVKITEFDVHLKNNDFDSVKLRLHIYNNNPDSENVKELLPENVFFNAAKDQHWVRVNLEKYNIRMNKPLWVSVEWVDSWTSPKPGSGSYLLTISTGKKEGYSFYRNTPEGPFTILFYKTSPAMYFKGYKIK